MTPFAKQFDTASWDPNHDARNIIEEDDFWDMDDDFVTHMKEECRQGRFV